MRFSEMFENHIVLQRGMPVPVWGEAESGAAVTVSVAGKSARAVAENGAFRVTLPALPAGGPYELVAEAEGGRVVLADCWVGEVWLAGGQSNMEMPLFAAEGARRYVETRRFQKTLRLKTISRKSCDLGEQFSFHFAPESSAPQPWRVADARSAALFSAIGYAFGDMLNVETGVPVGIISCNWGGTKVQPWVSPETLRREPVFQGDIEAYEVIRAKLGGDARLQGDRYQQAVRRMTETTDVSELIRLSLDDPQHYWNLDAALPWPEDGAAGDPNEPGCLFTHMLSRVFPFAMRGVLWYQGESSAQAEDADRYEEELRVMIQDWRRAGENDRLAFLLTQLAPYDTARRAFPCDWMKIRHQQLRLSQSCPNVHLCCIPDLGDARNIHPARKIEVARRMAMLAYETVYGWPLCWQGPVAEGAELAEDGVHVWFSHADGLRANHDPAVELSEDGKSFWPVDRITIVPGGLICSRGAMPAPRHVRFSWSPMMDDGLRNGLDLPAGPFLLPVRRRDTITLNRQEQ